MPIGTLCLEYKVRGMNFSPKSFHSDYTPTVPKRSRETCKIVVFWENFDGAIHARVAFDSIVQRLSGGRPVQASSWSFSMLESPEFNAAVLMDAACADVIVVAARGDRGIPERITSWLEVCAMREGGRRPVIVALHEEGLESGDGAAPLCSVLQRIATRQGAGFACSNDLKGGEIRKLGERQPLRQTTRSIQIQEPASILDAGNHRWCGIND